MHTLAFMLILFATDFSRTTASIEDAWIGGDHVALRAAIDSLKAAHAADPKPRTAYAIGYAERRLSYLIETPAAEKKVLLTDAVAQFEEVIKAEPKNAEAHALLASSLGSMIGLNPKLGMTLGRRSGDEMQNAIELEPNNPRVLLLAGVAAFYKPPEYGGGVEVAEPLLRRAASVFAQEPADRPWPNWGRFESHIFLGQLLEKLGKNADARTEFEAALALQPRSPWARAILQAHSK
jgi:tetratricopeptide (TPR) repeat protein